MRAVSVACVGWVCVFGAACVGNIGGDDSKGNGRPPGAEGEVAQEIAVEGMRRLSVAEYQRTVRDLVGLAPDNAREVLPVDTLAPFDNDYTLQTASEALIKGAELLAGQIADAVVADPTLRANVVGCEPQSASDDACFRSFVTTFGRRALRRPLSSAEVDSFDSLLQYGTEANDFNQAVDAALRAFLQHPEFLYRVEIGQPVDGDPTLHQLGDHELGARLSYLILGTTPPDWLLDEADAGSLHDPEAISAAAAKLLDDPRARDQMARFHAMWLSYSQLGTDGISGDMNAETEALIGKVIFDDKTPWTDILTSDETYVTPALAAHYGLPSPRDSAGWVSYGDSGRKGLLSQGTFLSAVAKFGDTSPTQRGLLVRSRMFCQNISKPPPELMVNVDMPPKTSDPNACKKQRYYMSEDPSCAGCHKLMDPIGFGLENYDAAGRYRTTEPNRPDCPIDGQGDLQGVGTFQGPAGLADLIVQNGEIEGCVAQQLYRFAIGRRDLDDHDQAILSRLVSAASAEGGLRIDQFITEYVSSDAFRFRRDEVSQ
jgi:hypothetical protein